MSDIMLDIETLGTTPGCVVLSIGACEFDSKDILNTFQVHVDPLDSEKHGAHIDASTAMWWLDQNDAARNSITGQKTVGLVTALEQMTGAFDWKGKRVWCNGAAFDFPILKKMFKQGGVAAPWAYYNEMDMRTIKGLLGKALWNSHVVQATVKHDGLADAIAQAKTMQSVFADDKGVRWAA